MADAPPSALSMPSQNAMSRSRFTFTDPGCRTEIRLGALFVLAGVFLWLWLGASTAGKVVLCGLPLLAVGVPVQAWQARTRARPGFPWKLGIGFTALGLALLLDTRWRAGVGEPVRVQETAPVLALCGAWILAWWPIARRSKKPSVA